MALDQFGRKSAAADTDVVGVVVGVGATIGKEEERKKKFELGLFCSGLDFEKAEQDEHEVASSLFPTSASVSSSTSTTIEKQEHIAFFPSQNFRKITR